MRALSYTAVLSLSNVALAFWRMNCGNVQVGRIDPIVSPGNVAGHVHKISGPSNFGASSTYDDLQKASCTSCTVQDDKSAYWTPKLYYSHANGSFEEVPDNGMTIYYLGRGDNRTNIQPFPPGFRMISGNNFARSYDPNTYTFGGPNGKVLTGGSCDGQGNCSSGTFVDAPASGQKFNGRPVSDAVSFKCLGGNETETPGFQSLNCPYGFRAQLHFQTCWNGVDLYKSDQSHVAHMSQIDNGICPPGYPVQFVHLFFEVLYGVNQIANQDGFFVFANGDKTGYGFHGDFMNGWKTSTLSAAVSQCANTDNAGQISACAPLMQSNSEQSSYNCPEQAPVFNEAVHGMLSKLPGCNPIEPGPAPAKPADHACPPGSPIPRQGLTSSAAGPYTTFLPQVNQVYSGWTYEGCATDSSNVRALSGSSLKNNSMTNTLCQSFCAQTGYPLAGVEYGRECYCGLSLASSSSLVQDCNAMVCAGNSSELCGGPSRLSLWNSTTFSGPRVSIPQSVNDTLRVSNGTTIRYLGCALDNTGNGQRALSKASYADGNAMTIESCANYCLKRQAALAGMEYSGECYCGDSLASSSAPGTSTSCNMNCAGNVTETCGGPNALSVWSLKN